MHSNVSVATFVAAMAAAQIFPVALVLGEVRDSTKSVVISASKSERELSSVANSVTVIDKAELERKQDYSLAEVLADQATLDVVSTGTKGASTSVSIRGANSEHTLVILDGIELNNPILPSRSFNFADLGLNSVERIEILRGAQSSLYGSDAMGGVINIISQKGQDDSVTLSSEAGSNSTFVEQLSASGSEDILNYAFSVIREDTEGISAADARSGNSENDSYGNTGYFANLGLRPSQDHDFSTIFRAIDSKSELDNFGGSFGDDLNREQTNTQYFWGSALKSKFMDQKLGTSLSYSLSDQSFSDDNDPDLISADFLRSKYKGFLQSSDLMIDYQITPQINSAIGIENEQEVGESDYYSDGTFGPFESNFDERSATTNGVYTQNLVNLSENLSLSLGARTDSHSYFGNSTTWSLAPLLTLPETSSRIFATAGSGYKAPSLFQLFSSYGSQDLEAEESLAFDFGVEQELLKNKSSIKLTYFNQKFDDLINFDPNTYIFSNIEEASTEGVETALNYIINESSTFKLAYTYLDATNDQSGQALLRRARHKLSADLSIDPSENLNCSIQTNYRSSSYDNDFSVFPSERTTLAGYTTVDLALNYNITSDLKLFGRVDNIFDVNYQEVFGYGTYGVSAFAGLKLTL
jgi:vitamin B12 transporter